jgi:choice-of-anchor B domain-containing protein
MQRFIPFLLLFSCLSTALFSQNLNTTFRSKVTFNNQTLANIWGYTANGREYALVGASKGMVVVDITDPDAPQQIVQIPGPDNLWKEIKTYGHYAYVASEGGGGLQIIDLQNLPAPNLPYRYYTGDSTINGQLNRLHALHVDTTKGFLYGWGSANLFGGGAIILDLKPDPYNPHYAGKYSQLGYIHDGYVDNDTMYSGHIYDGLFAVVDMTNKSAPKLIATQQTPDRFTHNTWVTNDRRTIFTTDERTNSVLAAYDISDLEDIRLLDVIQSNPGSNSIVHNTYVLGNHVVTSWYKDGFTIVDATKPDNLVQVGNYDTYPEAGDGFSGCWGVYPYFPSGNIIASNINAFASSNSELYIITPNYKRGCYLEGRITNAKTGIPINKAVVEILNSQPAARELTKPTGLYKMGQAIAGTYLVRVSKRGFEDFFTTAILSEGTVTIVDAALIPIEFEVSGTVRNRIDNLPVAGATVWLYGVKTFGPAITDAAGQFMIPEVLGGTYDVVGSAPGVGLKQLVGQWIQSDTSFTLLLADKFRRDAVLALRDLETTAVPTRLFASNPFSDHTELQYQTEAVGAVLKIYSQSGQIVANQVLPDNSGVVTVGTGLPAGIYHAAISQNGKILQTLKLVKTQ